MAGSRFLLFCATLVILDKKHFHHAAHLSTSSHADKLSITARESSFENDDHSDTQTVDFRSITYLEGEQLDALRFDNAKKCKLRNCAADKPIDSYADWRSIEESNEMKSTREKRQTTLNGITNNNIDSQQTENESSENGLSGMNALLRAMDAKKLNDSQIVYTEKFLELAVFLGEPAYQMLRLNFNMNDDQILEIILGFVNQIQAVFYQPSLRGKLHISLVHIELEKTPQFEYFNGDRDKLLDSFCNYQSKFNVKDDSDERHWDMALYLTSLNFFSTEIGVPNYVSMGLAPVGGVCYLTNNCVIAEFGAVNELGHPYPSAGLMSAWVAAHEMAHNLGIFHDGSNLNDCPENGYIMSSSRGTKGEVSWSSCSSKMFSLIDAECLHDFPKYPVYDHRIFNLRPGQRWDSNDQCKLFTRDYDAHVLNSTLFPTFCDNSIICKSPNKIGYFSAGPALEGTYCGDNNSCQNGKCLPDKSLKTVRGGWSKWKKSRKCNSQCIENSLGSKIDKRDCNNPKPQNTVDYCEGDAIRVKLCDDTKQCELRKRSRITANTYAQNMCRVFSKYVDDISSDGAMQIAHEPNKDWRACAIFCRLRTGYWYTPRYEMNDMQNFASPFFPEGTWCHRDEVVGDFYCQRHRCLPGNARKARNLLVFSADEDYVASVNMSSPLEVAQLKIHFTVFDSMIVDNVQTLRNRQMR